MYVWCRGCSFHHRGNCLFCAEIFDPDVYGYGRGNTGGGGSLRMAGRKIAAEEGDYMAMACRRDNCSSWPVGAGNRISCRWIL